MRAALINFFVPDVAFIRGRRLIEGDAYSSKYSSQEYLASEKSVLASEWNLSLATGLVGWQVSLESWIMINELHLKMRHFRVTKVALNCVTESHLCYKSIIYHDLDITNILVAPLKFVTLRFSI